MQGMVRPRLHAMEEISVPLKLGDGLLFAFCRGDTRLGEGAAGGVGGVRRGGGRQPSPGRKLGQGDRRDAEGRQLRGT